MAARPRYSTPAKAAAETVSSNAHDWLFLNPGGASESSIVFGYTRKEPYLAAMLKVHSPGQGGSPNR